MDQSERKQSFSISVDRSEMKEGQQALLITAKQPVHLTLRQEVFLPVGTLWRVTGWTKSQASAVSSKADAYSEKPSPGPRIGIEAEVGAQGFEPKRRERGRLAATDPSLSGALARQDDGGAQYIQQPERKGLVG